MGATKNTPESIISGFIIFGGKHENYIFSLEISWTLHVVVGRFSTENTTNNQISRIYNLISAYPSVRRSDRTTSSYWQRRLNLLRTTAPLKVQFRERRRRGLIDVGCKILHCEYSETACFFNSEYSYIL